MKNKLKLEAYREVEKFLIKKIISVKTHKEKRDVFKYLVDSVIQDEIKELMDGEFETPKTILPRVLKSIKEKK